MHFAGLESIGLMDDLLQSFDIGQLNSEQNLPGVNMSLNPIFSFLANEADDAFDVESLPNRFKSAIDSVYDDYEAYIQVIKLVDSAILTGVVGAMDQDICSLKSSLEEKDNQLIRLESRIKRITEDSLETKEKFNKQLGEKDACILNLEKQMSKLCQDMVQLALNLNEESKKSVFLEKKVKDIQIADNLKSKQISAMKEEMGKLKEERDFSLEQTTREFQIRELRLDEKMEHLVLDNERQISSLRRENAQHKTTIEASVALESNLREQIRKISEDHLNSLELVEKLEKEKQCLLKETVSLARLKDNELDTEINEIVQDQLDALEKDTEVLNDMLEDEVNDMGRQIRTLRHEVTVLENTIEEQKWMDELELSIIMDVYHGLLTDVTSISEVSGKIDSNQYIISDLADSNEVLEEVMMEQAANSIFEQNAQNSGGLCCENVVDEKRRLEIESIILMACLEGYSSDAGAAMEKLKTNLSEVKDKLASTQEELEISKFLEQEAHQEIDNLKSHLNTSSETRSRLMGSLHGNNQEENVQEMVAETVEQQPQSTEDLFKEEMQKFDIKEEMHKFDIDADVEDAIVAQDIETSIYLAYMEGLSADLTCSISDQNQLSALKDTKLGFVLSEVKSLRGILEAWRRLGTTHHISEYKPQPHDNVVDGFELADLLVDEVSELYKCISSWDPSEGNMLTSNLRESLLERCWQHQIEMEILVEIFLSKFKEVASANFQVYNTKLMQFKSPSKHMSSEVDDVLSTDGNGLDNVAGDNFANERVMDDELLPEEETESLILQLRTEISELRRERDQIIGEKTEEVYKMKREFYKELDRLRHEGNEQAIRLVEKINERSSEKGIVASHVECYSKGLSLQSNTQSGNQTRQDHGCYDNVETSELEGKNGRLVAYFSEVLKRKEHDMTLVLEEKEDMRKHKIKLEASVQDLRNDIKALIEQKEELLFQLDEERCHRFSMGAEVEKLICDNHNLKEELDYVQKQLQEERESKFDMEVDLQELASQVDHLKGKVELEENIKLRLESDVQKLEEKIANLNAAVSSSNVKLEESTHCVFRLELDLKRCRDETSTLVEALVATQKNLESEQNKRIMKEYNEDNLERGLCEAQKIVESGLATQMLQFEMFAKTVDATITGMSRRVQDVGICVTSMRGNAKQALLKQAEYKKNLRKNIRNLQKAEVEVDLLGDEVDYLLSLLDKVFAALNHYAPILKHYPGLLELSWLIKQELSLRVDCGN